MPIRFSDRQAHTIAVALTILAVLVIVLATGGLLAAAAAFFRRFASVFGPLVSAAIFALVVRPYFDWLSKRLPSLVALTMLFLSVLVPIVLFAWYLGAMVVEQVTSIFARLPVWYHDGLALIEDRWPALAAAIDRQTVGAQVRTLATEHGGNLLDGVELFSSRAWEIGTGLAEQAVSWAVFPLYLAFFLLGGTGDPHRIEEMFPFLKPETRNDVIFLIREFVHILVAFFRGQFIIALCQGLLFAIGFAAIGLDYGFVFGLMLGLLNVIPYFGSIVGLGIGLPMALSQPGGGFRLVGAVLIVFTIVQVIEGYVLTPKIMGDRTGLHPMAIVFAIFFWGSALGGILGMILAIPLTAFMVVLWRLARERYIRELV